MIVSARLNVNAPSGPDHTALSDPWSRFHSEHYLRHNRCRLAHLASLDLTLAHRDLLEVGAGIGDHSEWFIQQGARVTITEGRITNLEVIRERFPDQPSCRLDLDAPDPSFQGMFDVVVCYGLLYHLAKPHDALHYLAGRCRELLLLESCVLPGNEAAIHRFDEPRVAAENSISGRGCRPTRRWVFEHLESLFPHVYLPLTQPRHEEFPLDWDNIQTDPFLCRAIFIASRRPLEHPLLTSSIPRVQHHHEE